MRRFVLNQNISDYKQLFRFEPKFLSFERHTRCAYYDKVLVSVGQYVGFGEILAVGRECGYHLRASRSGRVISITDTSIEIEARDTHIEPVLDISADMSDLVREAGVFGMGGAGYPTHRKLVQRAGRLIINCCECEPGVSCDSALILHTAHLAGALAMAGEIFEEIHIAMKSQHTDVQEKVEKIISSLTDSSRIKLHIFTDSYPIGSDKILIKKIFDLDVFGKHSYEFGIITINISSIIAIYEATLGYILSDRIVSFGRDGDIKNVFVPIGTPVSELLRWADFEVGADEALIRGGIMMSEDIDSRYAISSSDTSIFLVKYTDEPEISCINCSKCVDICPSQLYPQILMKASYSSGDRLSELEMLGLDRCIECAMCSLVCPSGIDLVKYFRSGKEYVHKIKMQQQKDKKAEERKEFKKKRLENVL